MKKCVNGKYIEMTEEEILELKRQQEEYEKVEAMQALTIEERIIALEKELAELKEALT